MAQRKEKNGMGSMGAFIAGAAAAAVAGMYYLYGPKGREHRAKVEIWSLKAKAEVLEKVENTKQLSEEKYHDIITEVTKRYGKLKHVGKDRGEKLARELKRHWTEISAEAEKKGNAAKRKTNSTRRKIAKKTKGM